MNIRLCFACLALTATMAAPAQEWTRFRGPNGTGVSHCKTIPSQLSEADINWKVNLPGSGHSSPVLWGDKLFLTSTDDRAGGFSVLCHDARNGTILWKQDFSLTPFAKHSFNSFASATPVVDARRVYAAWNERDHYFLAALDHGGKVLWKRDFGSFISQHGSGTSPVLVNDKIILCNYQDDPKFIEGPHPDDRLGKSYILALSAEDGSEVWRRERRSTVVAYSTPCLYETGTAGETALLICNSQSHGISALNPADGGIVWEYEKAFDKRTVSSPVVAGDFILGTCGSGGGGAYVVAVNARGASSAHPPALAYQIKKAAPYVPTPVAAHGLVWLLSDAGIMTCIDASTGTQHFQERVGGNFFGSPIWIDGRVFAVSKTGEIVVVEAGTKFNVLSRFPLNEVCESTPAVANGKLFVRTEKHLWCLGGLAKAAVP